MNEAPDRRACDDRSAAGGFGSGDSRAWMRPCRLRVSSVLLRAFHKRSPGVLQASRRGKSRRIAPNWAGEERLPVPRGLLDPRGWSCYRLSAREVEVCAPMVPPASLPAVTGPIPSNAILWISWRHTVGPLEWPPQLGELPISGNTGIAAGGRNRRGTAVTPDHPVPGRSPVRLPGEASPADVPRQPRSVWSGERKDYQACCAGQHPTLSLVAHVDVDGQPTTLLTPRGHRDSHEQIVVDEHGPDESG